LSASERTWTCPSRRANKHDQRQFRYLQLHRLNTAICVGAPPRDRPARSPKHSPNSRTVARLPPPRTGTRPASTRSGGRDAGTFLRQLLELDVVLRVGRRYDNRGGLRELEQHSLERRQSGRIEMLNHLDQRRRVVSRRRLSRYVSAPASDRSAPAASAASDPGAAAPPRSPARDAKRPCPRSFRSRARPAGPAGAPLPQPRSITRLAPQPFRTETTVPNRCSFRLMRSSIASSSRAWRCTASSGSGSSSPTRRAMAARRQAPPVLQIPMRDPLALRMGCQPFLPVAQELFDLVLPDPVVLVVVKNRISTYRCESSRSDDIRLRDAP